MGQRQRRLGKKPLGFFAAEEILFRLIDVIEDFRSNQACGDFTQRDDRRLIVLTLDQRLGAIGYPPRTLGGNNNQIEQVIDVLEPILDSDSGHGVCPLILWTG